MPDLKYVVYLDGDASGFGAAAKKAANELNALDKFESKSRKNQQLLLQNEKQTLQLAKQQRREAFDKLSIEEKTNRLLLQRNRLMQLQERMQARGNMVAASAHRLALAQTNAQLRGLSGGASAGGGSSVAGGMMGGMLARYFGPAALAFGAFRGVTGRLRKADDIADTADQMGLSTEKYMTLEKAARGAGISPNRVFAAIEAMKQSRARALTDPKEAAKFARYGISRGQLAGSQDEMDLGMQIQRSIGSGGMDKYDSPILRSLLGKQPGRILDVFKSAGTGDYNSQDASANVKKLAETQRKVELIQNTAGEFFDKVIVNLADGFRILGEFSQSGKLKTPEQIDAETAEANRGKTSAIRRTAATGPLTISSSFARNSIATEADSLTRIGLYRGGQSQGMNLQMQHLQEARRQTQELRMLNYKVAAPNDPPPM